MELIFCEFNMDTSCVELLFIENISLNFDCAVIEQQYANTVHQRCELDYLVYNSPCEYAHLVLTGQIAEYLRIA